MHLINPDLEYIDIYLEAKKWAGEITNLKLEKCEEIFWFSDENRKIQFQRSS